MKIYIIKKHVFFITYFTLTNNIFSYDNNNVLNSNPFIYQENITCTALGKYSNSTSNTKNSYFALIRYNKKSYKVKTNSIIDNKYKVTCITPNNIELEDINTKEKKSLQLK